MRALVLLLALPLVACGQPATPPAKAPEAPPAIEPASQPAPAPPEAAPPPVVALPPPTDAEIEARYTPHHRHCLETGDAARGVTPAMAGCFNEELRLQDGALNAEYQRVMRGLDPAGQAGLRAAQRQWIVDRDESCAEAANSGGTIDMIERPACHLRETVKRTIELERMGVR